MAESWRERYRRQVREMDAAVRALVAALPSDDQALRARLEAVAERPYFGQFTWAWGPAIAGRNRVLFRPFILSHFSSFALDARGEIFDPWKGKAAKAGQAAALERWLAAADAADDVELTRRLYAWRLLHLRIKDREPAWRRDVLTRFAAAPTPAARFTALAKIDAGWPSLDAETALALFERDRAAARAFIVGHLPIFGWGGAKRRDWDGLLERARERDPDFHFDLYRRIVDEKRWRADVLALAREVADPATFDAELERRHPRVRLPAAAEVFLALGQARKREVVPYLLRHVGSVFPRWGFIAQREAKGFEELLALAEAEGWLDLWAALLGTGATRERFDAEVRRLVRAQTLPAAEVRTRLSLIAGPGREAHLPGISFAQVQPLSDETALELYRRFPDLLAGPYRMHVSPGWHDAHPRLVGAAIDAGDLELVDFLAARAGIQTLTGGEGRGWKETIDRLTSHYEALPEAEFVRRAASALSRMPAFAVWSYDDLLRKNRLARLFFERSTSLYLSDALAVRDLLESPQIHVQALAFRILGQDDPRAPEVAARSRDLLQATLLRPLHRRTRLLAFRALEKASQHDEATARFLLGRMREALALPEKRYPTEKLVGLIGKVLHRWPSLRGPGEVPRVYGEVEA